MNQCQPGRDTPLQHYGGGALLFLLIFSQHSFLVQPDPGQVDLIFNGSVVRQIIMSCADSSELCCLCFIHKNMFSSLSGECDDSNFLDSLTLLC